MRALLAAAVSVCLLATTVAAADAAEATDYVPPVDAPVIDEFRPPAHRYGPGNRGLEYGTRPGQTVRAAANGTVSFAGDVAGRLVVSIRHPDGLRTTYSGLASVAVARGQAVDADTPIGTASNRLHFGVRAGDAYLDPAALLGGRRRVFLVADDIDRRVTPAYVEHLLPGGDGLLGGAIDAAARRIGEIIDDPAQAWSDLLDVIEDVAFRIDPSLGHAIQRLREWNPISIGLRLVEVWRELNRDCTSSSTAPPPPPAERRILVVVGGLRSDDGDDLVDDVAPTELGYDDGDVVRFSYEGGATPGTGHGLGLDEHAYEPGDTEVGLRESAEHLDDLIEDIGAAAPGVPIDIVAHSQGGVITRLALDEPGTGVERVVTLATPHRGADLATFLTEADENIVVDGAGTMLDAVDDAWLGDQLVAIGSQAIADLAETSDVIQGLPPVPDDVDLTSIATGRDIIVPNTKSRVDGHARWTVVNGGWHGDLPGSAAGRRETALALGGLPPTCRSLLAGFGDALLGEVISLGTDAAAVATIGALERFDIGPRLPATRTDEVPG